MKIFIIIRVLSDFGSGSGEHAIQPLFGNPAKGQIDLAVND